jgi:hypothetical protein
MILVEANLELVHDCFASSSDILPSAKHGEATTDSSLQCAIT